MKNIFNIRFIIALLILIIAFLIIIISASKIKLNPSIQSLFPHDKKMERSLALSSLSSSADKVILYVEVNDKTWVGEICRKEGKLMKPSDDFFVNLQKIEACFNVYHGESLKPGPKAVTLLSAHMLYILELPQDVNFFC